jgi:hypothetical protein
MLTRAKELEQSGLHFFDRWTSHLWGDQVLLQFDDIRDSTLVFTHSRVRTIWVIRYLTLNENPVVQVTNPSTMTKITQLIVS